MVCVWEASAGWLVFACAVVVLSCQWCQPFWLILPAPTSIGLDESKNSGCLPLEEHHEVVLVVSIRANEPNDISLGFVEKGCWPGWLPPVQQSFCPICCSGLPLSFLSSKPAFPNSSSCSQWLWVVYSHWAGPRCWCSLLLLPLELHLTAEAFRAKPLGQGLRAALVSVWPDGGSVAVPLLVSAFWQRTCCCAGQDSVCLLLWCSTRLSLQTPCVSAMIGFIISTASHFYQLNPCYSSIIYDNVYFQVPGLLV